MLIPMKNKQNNELAVCGFEAVKAIERHDSAKIRRLYFTPERAPQFGALCRAIAERRGIYNQVEDPAELERLCGSVHHQGVVAMIPYPEIPPLTAMEAEKWAEKKELVLLLDRIGNANNFGAIARSAAFFGVTNFAVYSGGQPLPVTTSSYRTAQGGMEYISLFRVSSPVRFLSDMDGKMFRLGTDVRGSCPLSHIHGRLPPGRGTVLVLGNEETGISAEIRRCCDCLAGIPGTGAVESLNVAQAAAVFLYELTKDSSRFR